MFRSLITFSLLVSARLAFGSEYQENENIAAASAQDASLGINRALEERIRAPARKFWKDALSDSIAFWRDGSIDLRLRAFDFTRDNGLTTISDATAIGSELTFTSGKVQERLSLAATWHTSFATDAPPGLGGTGILGPDQSDISVLSRLYLKYDINSNASIKLFRQDFNLPFLNRLDSRMIPNTHEAYIVEKHGAPFEFIGGYVTKVKKRDSDEFVTMGEAAGLAGSNAGTALIGANLHITDELNVGALVQHTNDLFTTAYSETSYRHTIDENWGLQLAAQLTNQRSTGDELLGDFDTYAWGIRGVISYRGAVLKLAHTRTGTDAAIRKPWGGTPSFTSSMLFDFDRPGEEAWRIGLSQNFAKYNLPGVSLIVNYTRSSGSLAPDGSALPDADEIAITADYRPQETFLKGLWLRVRYAEADRNGPLADRRDLRIILNYNLSALR